jgi:hypothetical protein
MPTGTGKFTGPGLLALLNGSVPWGSDDLYFALVNATGNTAINIDTTDFWNDLVANEVTGTGWATNGKQLAGESISLVTGSNDVVFLVSDISSATTTLTGAKAGIVYSRTPGTDATREVVGFVTFDVELAPQGGTLDIDFDGTNGFCLIDYT